MRELRFIDVTVRDGQQSLWATRMTNEMILPMLPKMDRMGFAWIDLVGGAVFDVCVRYLHEDPWERMRLASQVTKVTPLNVWTRGQSLFTFEFFPDDIVALALERCAANGMGRLTTYDALNDIRNIEVSVRTAKEAEMFVSGQVVYTVSPVHTDAYYEKKAEEIIALGVDSLGIKDPSGLLTPERARTLVPALRKVAGELPLELHSHCRSGLGELVYLEAAPLGIDILHTGVRPLCSGDALPDVRYVMRHLRERGFEIPVKDADLARMEDYFLDVAETHGKPIGQPRPYDPFLYHHQVPGGMISNLRSQLEDIDMGDRLDAVLEGSGPCPGRSRLSHFGQPFRAIRRHSSGYECRTRRALCHDTGRSGALCLGVLWRDRRAGRCRCRSACARHDGRCRARDGTAGIARAAACRSAQIPRGTL